MKGPSSDRKDRLAAALRENLKRRKARARVLKDEAEPPKGEAAAASSARPNPARNQG